MIKYLANIRLPTSRAHGYAIMKMCSEFSRLGAEVKLVIPKRKNNEGLGDNPYAFYGIEENFQIDEIRNPDLLGRTGKLGFLFYWIDLLFFIAGLIIGRKIKPADTVYTRDYILLLFLRRSGNNFLEVHDLPKSKLLFKTVIKKVKLFIVLNEEIKKELISLGIGSKKIQISPSAVDIREFDINIGKEEARREVGLPVGGKIVIYTGHLYEWKGVSNLIEVARQETNTLFVFLGGVEPEFSKIKHDNKEYKNIIILPFARRNIVPVYLKAADVLVVPNSRRTEISEKFTSPLKLFEYMAAKRPIVASGLPSLRQILNESCAVFAEADNTQSLRLSIQRVLADDGLAKTIADNAFNIVKDFTWEKRAENIIRLIRANG